VQEKKITFKYWNSPVSPAPLEEELEWEDCGVEGGDLTRLSKGKNTGGGQNCKTNMEGEEVQTWEV